jgi:hypothetical protein
MFHETVSMPKVAPDPKTTAPSVPIAIAVVMSSVLQGNHEFVIHKMRKCTQTN